MRRLFWLSVLLAACAAAPAAAKSDPRRSSHCVDDAYKFCEAQIPVEADVERCLRAHVSELTSGCRRELDGPGPAKKARKPAR